MKEYLVSSDVIVNFLVPTMAQSANGAMNKVEKMLSNRDEAVKVLANCGGCFVGLSEIVSAEEKVKVSPKKVEMSNIFEEADDTIALAINILKFKEDITNGCTQLNIKPPTDKEIGEYVRVYGLSLKDFMADFTEGEGMFRNLAFQRFKERVRSVCWGKNEEPTEEEIKDYFMEHGNNFHGFMNEITLKNMKPIEKETYLATVNNLKENKLVELFNHFIEECSHYGEDTRIYDLTNEKERKEAEKFLTEADKPLYKELLKNGARYIQRPYDNNNFNVHEIGDIKEFILSFWNEIFERVMLYPYSYEFDVELYHEGDGSTYFSDVFWVLVAKKLGYELDGFESIEYVGKS